MLDKQTAVAMENFDRWPDDAFVKLPVVQALFSCSDETVRQRVKQGRIPAPVKLGPRLNGWRVGDLRKALSQLQGAA